MVCERGSGGEQTLMCVGKGVVEEGPVGSEGETKTLTSGPGRCWGRRRWMLLGC